MKDISQQERNDTYKSVASLSQGLFKDNGSRFISFVYPVESESEIKTILESVRKEYHDARHHCYAYRLGLEGSVFRSNDDGEPSGSAGRQILGQIDSAGLSDILVVVVRYFGGIKLGIPGLIRAYRTSVQDALSKASFVEKIAAKNYHLEFAYEAMNDVMKVLKDLSIPQKNQSFDAVCSMDVRVRLSQEQDFIDRLDNFLLSLNDI